MQYLFTIQFHLISSVLFYFISSLPVFFKNYIVYNKFQCLNLIVSLIYFDFGSVKLLSKYSYLIIFILIFSNARPVGHMQPEKRFHLVGE